MALPFATIVDAVDIFFRYMYSGNLVASDGGKPLGLSTYCEAYYNYVSQDGTLFSSQPVSFTLIGGSSYLESLSVSADYYSMIPFIPTGSVPTGFKFLANNSSLRLITNGMGIVWRYSDGVDTPLMLSQYTIIWRQVPTLTYPDVPTTSTWIAGSPSVVTNDSGLASRVSANTSGDGGLYLPIEPDTSYTYTDALNLVVLHLQQNGYPEASSDDFISFEQINPTEPTEPIEPTCNFTFDYSEVISPTELESILNNSDYSLSEIPTGDFLNFDEVNIPSETFENSYLSFFPKVINFSWDYFSSVGLTGVIIATSILVVIIRIVKGD